MTDSKQGRFRADLFEIDNARNLSIDELVKTFVPTKAFWRLLSAKNHIVLGSRGSGKTALAKMLSHEHLSKFENDRVKQAIADKAYIGIYVPTRLEWVSGLKNKPWQTEVEGEDFFQWSVNLSTCLSFLSTLRSCLETYTQNSGEYARKEAEIIGPISTSWSEGKQCFDTARALQNYLRDLAHARRQQITRQRVNGHLRDNEEIIGSSLAVELFQPLRYAIDVTSDVLCFPEKTAWLVCLDEAEFLQPVHIRILNSHLRAYPDNVFLKITTMPYCHDTLETNAGVPLNVGHDFEYVYIDQDPILSSREGRPFAMKLFLKRATVSGARYRGLSLNKWLGASELLEPKVEEWGPTSENMSLLREHGSPETVRRAEKLAQQGTKFRDQIARKIHAALFLRDAVSSERGRGELDVYAGDAMAIRCGDANPRRLIRIFNSYILEARPAEGLRGLHPLSAKDQTRVLTAFSRSTLDRVQSEPEVGPQMYQLLNRIGEYMRYSLHERPLTTDPVSSIRIDSSVPDETWNLIRRAVALAFLFPNMSIVNPDQLPERSGTFHLAYVLAPHFKLLPRRGASRSLSTILGGSYQISSGPESTRQLRLKFLGEEAD